MRCRAHPRPARWARSGKDRRRPSRRQKTPHGGRKGSRTGPQDRAESSRGRRAVATPYGVEAGLPLASAALGICADLPARGARSHGPHTDLLAVPLLLPARACDAAVQLAASERLALQALTGAPGNRGSRFAGGILGARRGHDWERRRRRGGLGCVSEAHELRDRWDALVVQQEEHVVAGRGDVGARRRGEGDAAGALGDGRAGCSAGSCRWRAWSAPGATSVAPGDVGVGRVDVEAVADALRGRR